MKKIAYITVGLLILLVIISVIFQFRMKSSYVEINENIDIIFKEIVENKRNADLKNLKLQKTIELNQKNANSKNVELQKTIELNRKNAKLENVELQKTIELNQRNTEEIISGLEQQLTTIFTELKKYESNRSSGSEDLSSVLNRTVESDYQKHKLLSEGLFEYENGNFTEAINIYKEVIDIDPTDIEAICYLNVSLYNQNPGDYTNFSEIKNNLIFLLERKALTYDEERTTLNVLIGISKEEGRADSLQKYQKALNILEDSRK